MFRRIKWKGNKRIMLGERKLKDFFSWSGRLSIRRKCVKLFYSSHKNLPVRITEGNFFDKIVWIRCWRIIWWKTQKRTLWDNDTKKQTYTSDTEPQNRFSLVLFIFYQKPIAFNTKERTYDCSIEVMVHSWYI